MIDESPGSPGPVPVARPTRAARVRTVLGEIVLTFGAVAVLFAAWGIWGTGLAVAAPRRALARQLARLWEDPVASAPASPVPAPPPAPTSVAPSAAPSAPAVDDPAPAEGGAVAR